MKQTAVKYGIITGIATVLYLFFFYTLDRSNATNTWVSFSTLIITVIGMVAANVAERKKVGSLERSEALKIAFSVAVVSGLFFYTFLYLLFNFIDPELAQIVVEKNPAQDLEASGQPFEMTVGKVFFGYAFSLVYGFLLALMVANFVKKRS